MSASRPMLIAAVAVLLAVSGCTATSDVPTGSPATSAPSAPSVSSVSSNPPTSVAPTSTTRSAASTSRSASSPSTKPSSMPPGMPPGPVAGLTVALNPGHNGGNGSHEDEIARPVPSGFGQTRACDTSGTSTGAGYPEHAFNWDVTLRLRRLLLARGVHVVLTRPTDTGVGPCIDERARIANAPGVAAVISIHADGADPGGHGFHICEASQPPAGARVAARSHALTVAVHDAVQRGSGLVPSTYLGTNGYFPRNDLAGLNLATVPATFAELGNMRNAGDAALLTSAAGRQRIADALAAGILAWLPTLR